MWRVIQAEGRELSSRWSFKKNCNESKSCKTTTKRVHSGKARDGPSHGGKSAKGPGERGQELKISRHGYNQEKNQGFNLKSQVVLLKA